MSSISPVNFASSDAEDAAPPTQLALEVARRIRESGPMTFRDFMDTALYEPGLGYYSGSHTPWSDAADFVTAPQVDAVVGATMAQLAGECDDALGSPGRFDLIEFGGGDGTLMGDLCDALRAHNPSLYERLRVVCIEQGEASRAQQAHRLQEHGARVSWFSGLEDVGPGDLAGLVVSNELLDALPVHRVVMRNEQLREIFVGLRGDAFVDVEQQPSTDALAAYLRANDTELPEGQGGEICLAVRPWVEAVAARLDRGFVATIDYGSETASLFDPEGPGSSLVCQHRYQLNASPYERIGEQDITTHVDWGNLRRCAAAAGLADIGMSSLAVFLLGFGAAEGLNEQPSSEADADAVRRRLGLRHLLFTEISDAHRVMLLAKGVEPIEFGIARLDGA